jgi:hypothetical protein
MVLLIAHRYGTPPTGHDHSITELEFEEALKLDLPILAFQADPDYPWPPAYVETEPEARARLAKFTQRVREKVTARSFSTPDSLEVAITHALSHFVGGQMPTLPHYAEETTIRGVRREQEVGTGSTTVPVAEAQTKQEAQVQATQLQPAKIFLCYRREDTQGFARGIYQSLVGKYGHEQVFRDIDSTPPGVRFAAWIESRVSQCSVMIVLIGKAWLSAEDQHKQRRLDLPKDWVRQEIGVALSRDISIIPVLVQGAPMPTEDELPDSITDLASFQSTEVTDSRWDFDVGLLLQAIDYCIASDQSK